MSALVDRDKDEFGVVGRERGLRPNAGMVEQIKAPETGLERHLGVQALIEIGEEGERPVAGSRVFVDDRDVEFDGIVGGGLGKRRSGGVRVHGEREWNRIRAEKPAGPAGAGTRERQGVPVRYADSSGSSPLVLRLSAQILAEIAGVAAPLKGVLLFRPGPE